MGARPAARQAPPGGFTLIEVIAALVVFTAGVLMVIRLSGGGGTQMRYAGIRSELAVRAAERVDSLAAEPFGSLSFGTSADTFAVEGIRYRRTVSLVRQGPLLAHLQVELEPLGGRGPTYGIETYLGSSW